MPNEDYAKYYNGMTAGTHPDPNTLSVVNPYTGGIQTGADIAPAFSAQQKGLIYTVFDATSRSCKFNANFSNNAANGTFQAWKWHNLDAIWVKQADPFTITGDGIFNLAYIGNGLTYIQCVSISAGTVGLSVVLDGFAVVAGQP